jgi:hypothetical protein
MLVPDETMRLHAGIAAAIIAERTISTGRLSTALMHATVGKAEEVVSKFISQFVFKMPQRSRGAPFRRSVVGAYGGHRIRSIAIRAEVRPPIIPTDAVENRWEDCTEKPWATFDRDG